MNFISNIWKTLGRTVSSGHSYAPLSNTATFETKPYRLYKLDKGPSTTVTVTREDALKYYEDMQIIRRTEAKCGDLYKEKIIRGFLHLCSGQEGTCVGIVTSMGSNDTIITAYRCHGYCYLMGISPLSIIAELKGSSLGHQRGKGGSMHLYCERFYGGNGIVGAQVPVGTGIAFAHKYNNTDAVSFTLFGDGAANQGQVFESFNLAKLWNLPVCYVCENNGYGMGTSAERASANTQFYTRGDYIPGIWVDGMDVLAVREATKFAIEYIRAGNGPILMESATYRYFGHSMSDPGTSYRNRDEVQEVRQTRDPITQFRERLVSSQLATEDELKIIDKAVRKSLDEAVAKTRADPELGLEDLCADVYSKPLRSDVRNVMEWKPYKHKTAGAARNLK